MEHSHIEWTDHTFNPWWGCIKVSDGCKNCYAETLDRRWNGGHWGPGSQRKAMSNKYWLQPLLWDEKARKAGVKAKVFCASMADVFEGHPDTLPHLTRLFRVIENTPNLIWQLLTKRPENIVTLLRSGTNWMSKFPDNVWIGTSVENQKAADERIKHLSRVPASVRFLSCEPLLGPVDLSTVFGLYEFDENKYALKVGSRWADSPDWIIAGGESGHHARPAHPDWIRLLRDQCAGAGVPFFFKQWGEWVSEFHPAADGIVPTASNHSDSFTTSIMDGHDYLGQYMIKVGKKAAGATLDGKEWKQFPVTHN
ncbi:DUF5131 family protein [Pedobacter sp. HMF7056]|uniref:DUF5131 family protein n=2 Tax=Hufsiella ginkgonis TaxID=2695274 RepID=A0A7K1Y167_9SPHI|nr:DUF5131 family protein [Hufsiella ginkgonis]